MSVLEPLDVDVFKIGECWRSPASIAFLRVFLALNGKGAVGWDGGVELGDAAVGLGFGTYPESIRTGLGRAATNSAIATKLPPPPRANAKIRMPHMTILVLSNRTSLVEIKLK